MRKLLFALALVGGLAFCWAQTDNTDFEDPDRPESELTIDIDDEDSLDAKATAIIAAASTFTPEELSSRMMSISEQKTTKGNNSGGGFWDWCLEHLFISGIVALLIATGGTWLVYRICRFLFITNKKS